MLAHDVWAGLFEVEANMVFDNVHVKGRASTGISLALLARRHKPNIFNLLHHLQPQYPKRIQTVDHSF